MTYAELVATIAASTKEDWVTDSNQENWTYKGDLNIRFKASTSEVIGSERTFDEPWAITLGHGQTPWIRTFDIYYASSYVHTVYTVAVDGYRCYIPYTRSRDDLTITRWDYRFAKILEPYSEPAHYSLDSYLERAKISVK